MARYGLSVTKTTAFRGVQQHFSNTYYYTGPIPNSATGDLNDLVDKVVAFERNAHSPLVNFTRARLWSADQGNAGNTMIVDKSLSGVGSGATTLASMDRERAFLVQFRAGVDSKGRPVYLRKWFHLLVGVVNATNVTSSNLEQQAQLAAGVQTGLVNLGENLKSITTSPGAFTMALCGPGGRAITGATKAHPWLEHHQLGDEWRGT